MSRKLVSDLLVDYLERRGVTKLFGLCGHTVIGMLDALSRSEKIQYIGTRHESVASCAADGYARITHKASVVMCQAIILAGTLIRRCRCMQMVTSTSCLSRW